LRRRPHRPPVSPYTTLFRSPADRGDKSRGSRSVRGCILAASGPRSGYSLTEWFSDHGLSSKAPLECVMFSLVCCVAVKRCRTSSLLLMLAAAAAATFSSPPVARAAGKAAPSDAWRAIEAAFTPPADFADDLGDYRSPPLFND